MRPENVLPLLEDYLGRYPEEADRTRQVMDFVANEPEFWSSRTRRGHLTASAWIENPGGTRALLTHHRKLKLWLQLGGHMEDSDSSPLEAALREAREESGMRMFDISQPELFDLDVHEIPARGEEPAHLHLDLRFRLRALSERTEAQEAESLGLRWIAEPDFASLDCDDSVRRMVRKWKNA